MAIVTFAAQQPKPLPPTNVAFYNVRGGKRRGVRELEAGAPILGGVRARPVPRYVDKAVTGLAASCEAKRLLVEPAYVSPLRRSGRHAGRHVGFCYKSARPLA